MVGGSRSQTGGEQIPFSQKDIGLHHERVDPTLREKFRGNAADKCRPAKRPFTYIWPLVSPEWNSGSQLCTLLKVQKFVGEKEMDSGPFKGETCFMSLR